MFGILQEERSLQLNLQASNDGSRRRAVEAWAALLVVEVLRKDVGAAEIALYTRVSRTWLLPNTSNKERMSAIVFGAQGTTITVYPPLLSERDDVSTVYCPSSNGICRGGAQLIYMRMQSNRCDIYKGTGCKIRTWC